MGNTFALGASRTTSCFIGFESGSISSGIGGIFQKNFVEILEEDFCDFAGVFEGGWTKRGCFLMVKLW